MRSALILLSLILFTINDVARSERPDQVEYPTYYANVNGLTIAYQEFGDPEHETIMLVMGLGGQLIHWDDDLVWQLTDAGFHVIRFDNRDAGWSSKLYHESTPGILTGLRYKLGMSLGSPYKLDDMADDALGLLAHLNVKAAHVVGMSMGGMIAQIMAAKDPDTIQSLTSIMSSTGAEHLPAGTVDLNLSDRSDQTREQAILASARIGQQIDGTVAELSESQWIALTARSYDRSHYPEGFGRQFWAILDSGDRVELLKSIKQPALVIHGKADNLLPYQHGEHTAELISDSRLLLIEGMGHYIDRLNKPLIVKEIIKIASK